MKRPTWKFLSQQEMKVNIKNSIMHMIFFWWAVWKRRRKKKVIASSYFQCCGYHEIRTNVTETGTNWSISIKIPNVQSLKGLADRMPAKKHAFFMMAENINYLPWKDPSLPSPPNRSQAAVCVCMVLCVYLPVIQSVDTST